VKRINGVSWILWELRSLHLRVRVRVLRINTFTKHKYVTQTQEKKFFSSLAPDPTFSRDYRQYYLAGAREIRRTTSQIPYRSPDLEDYLVQINRNVNQPRLFEDEEYGRHVRTVRAGKSFGMKDFQFWMNVYARQGFTKHQSNLDGWLDFNSSFSSRTTDLLNKEAVMGVISPIQEKGLKLRAVANPFPYHQWALKPLGDCLFDILKQVPTDYTHNQLESLPAIREILRWNKRIADERHASVSPSSDTRLFEPVHSVDLSDATNQFPLEVQVEILTEILGTDYAEQLGIFQWVSKGVWQTNKQFSMRQNVRWTKGQPLGLYPSFASFALSHNALLLGLSMQHGGLFFVIGDDVVIHGNKLHEAYLGALASFKVSYSPEKTISSYFLAEFAGSVIHPSGWFSKGKEGPLTPTSILSRVEKHGEAEFQYMRKYILGHKTMPKEVKDSLTRALYTYDAKPTYLGGGGHVPEFPSTFFFKQEKVQLKPMYVYADLPPVLAIGLRKGIDNTTSLLWRSWQYRHTLTNALRSKDVNKYPTVTPKGNGRSLIAQVIKCSEEGWIHSWMESRLTLAQR